MASQFDQSSSSIPLPSSNSFSSMSQTDLSTVSKAFNYIPTKLDANNYIFWKAQVLATIRAFDLLSFLNKSPPPSKYVSDSTSSSEALVVNPEKLNWMCLDQLLLGWLFSTIDKEVLAQVIQSESSAEVWSSLENLYSRQTIAKSFQLKEQLRLIRKDSLSVSDYILKIKTIRLSLAAIGESLSDKDVLLAILNGLDHEYETIVSLVTYQMDEIDLEKMQYLLMMHEQHLNSKNMAQASVNFESVMSNPINVNMTSIAPRNGNNSREGFKQKGGGYLQRGGKGRGRTSNRRFYCQLCGKPGHLVDKCYHRFDRNFQRNSASQNYQQSQRATSNNAQTSPGAYLASFNDSNEAYMTDIGSSQGTSAYGNLSTQFSDNSSSAHLPNHS